MVKWLFKYSTVIFIFNTILLAIKFTYTLGSSIFLGLLFVFSFVLLINSTQIKYIIFHKAFRFFLVLNIINIVYWLVFHAFLDYDAGKYLLARGLQFAIISFSIYYNFEYYKNKFLEHLVYVIFGVIVIGLVANLNIFSGRYSGIIWNPNQLASFSVIGFSILLLNYKKKTNSDYFLLLVFLVISLATGSRGVLIGIPLAFIFKFGFSMRNMLYASLASFAYLIIITTQLDTSLNRFAAQSMFNDRVLQYEYAIASIQQKPFVGYGLDKYSYIDKSLVPVFLKDKIVGAHNGYLALLTQYGIIFGGLILYIIFQQSYRQILFFRNSLEYERVYIFIIIYTLITALYETLMTGINEFHTILFWFSLAILSYSKFNQENAN